MIKGFKVERSLSSLLEVSIYVVIGLLIFFLGLSLVESALRKITAQRLKAVLKLCTSNLASSIITGIVVTAVIQSSSAVTVMIISLVSGGVMSITQAMGVMIGSNIGTTVTLHILTFEINQWEWIFGFIGLVLLIYGLLNKRSEIQQGGLVFVGFSLIFFGLTILQLALAPLKTHPFAVSLFVQLGQKPFLAILAGLCFTALIQSSSATSGLVLTLATGGMISLKAALGIILGSNIGTCVTAILAGIKVNILARRIAYFHVIFNCFGVLVFIPLLDNFTVLINSLSMDLGRQIAVAHTLFNLATAILILPSLKLWERILGDDL